MKILFSLLFAVLFLPLNLFSQPSLELVWKKPLPTGIGAAKFSKDGNFIYCAIGNNIQIMDAKTGEFLSAFDNTNFPGKFYSFEISDDGNYIVSDNGIGSFTVWDVQEKKLLKIVSFIKKLGYDGTRVVDISSIGEYIIVYVVEWLDWNRYKGYIVKYDFINDREILRIPFDNGIEIIQISHDGRYFVTGSTVKNSDNTYNDQLILWDAVTMQQIKVLEDLNIGGAYEGYKSLKFSFDDSLITSVQRNFKAKVLNIYQNKTIISSDSTRLCMNLELLPGNEDYLISYGTWEGDFDLEYYNLSLKKETYKYNCEIIESTGNVESWKVFTGTPKDYFYLLNRGITGINVEEDVVPISLFQDNNQLVIKNFINFRDEIILSISDLSGKEYYCQKIQQLFPNNEFIVNIHLSSGIYICKIQTGTKFFTKKFEIVR